MGGEKDEFIPGPCHAYIKKPSLFIKITITASVCERDHIIRYAAQEYDRKFKALCPMQSHERNRVRRISFAAAAQHIALTPQYEVMKKVGHLIIHNGSIEKHLHALQPRQGVVVYPGLNQLTRFFLAD